jgi:hypothetical protein
VNSKPAFDSPFQERIYRALGDLVGAASADLYFDACQIRNGAGDFRSSVLIVGHLFREIESSLRNALAEEPSSGNGRHKRHLELALEALELDSEDPNVGLWKRFTNRNDPRHLISFAHRQALGNLREFDADFVAMCSEFDALMAFVLDRMETRSVSIAQRLDLLLTQTPSREQIKLLRNNIPNARYLFSRLFSEKLSQAWIDAFLDEGFFASPPTGASLPATNLARSLSKHDAERAVKVLEAIPKILDPFMVANYADVALAVPVSRSRLLMSRLQQWVADTDFVIADQALSSRLADLVVKLAEAGDTTAAITFLRALLELRPVAQEIYYYGPLSRFDDYFYDAILKRVTAAIAAREPLGLLDLLCDLLNVALQGPTAAPLGDEVIDDQSLLWLPAMGDRSSQRRTGLKEALAASLVEVSGAARAQGAATVQHILAKLNSYRYLVFRRCATFLLIQAGDGVDNRMIVDELLADRNYAGLRPTPEFAELLNAHAALLDETQIARVLHLIDSGLDLSKFRSDLGAEVIEEINDERRWTYLPLVEDYLDEDASNELKRISGKYEKLSGVTSYRAPQAYAVGPPSPWSAEQLRKMSVSELATALNDWDSAPTQGFLMQAGLGPAQQLRQIVSEAPQSFAGELDVFATTQPIYAYYLLAGFQDGLRLGNDFDWGPVLAFIDAHIDRSAAVGVPKDEITWEEFRTKACELIAEGIRGQYRQIPTARSDIVLDIVERAATKPTRVAAEPQGQDSALTRSFFNARAAGVRALLTYANWMRNEDTPSDLSARDGIRSIQRVRDLLDRLVSDPSDSVRAVFGENFEWLCRFDVTWATEISSTLFPTGNAPDAAAFAAWETFIYTSQGKAHTYAVLAQQYRLAARLWEIPVQPSATPDFRYDYRLCDHLLTLYWHGAVDLEDALKPLYQRVGDDAAAHGMFFVGRSLSATNIVPLDVATRLKAFWEWRMREIECAASEHQRELQALGCWLVSHKLDERWMLEKLEQVLTLTGGKAQPDHQILGALAAVSDAVISRALNCLEQVVVGNKTPWMYHFEPESIRRLLRRGVEAGAPASTKSREIVGRLIARQVAGFEDALEP